MDVQSLLTSFDGRISRQPFWIGIIVMAVALVIAWFVLNLFLPFWLVLIIVNLAAIYPWLALAVKRLHDHGDPAMPLAAVFIAPSLIAALLQILGLTMTTVVVADIEVPTLNSFGWIVQLIVLVIGLWALYYLGIKRGQDSDNQYGPNPLRT